MTGELAQPLENGRPNSVWLAALMAATLCVFLPSLGAPFHLDDLTLAANPVVRSQSGWWEVWRPLHSRPLTYLTFWMNFQLGGENPAGYHAFNIAAHCLAVWLFYGLAKRISGANAGFAAAAVFALHPIQVEPVAYVFERATILATVFCLLAAHAWLDGNTRRTIGCFLLALLSKEECVTFPVFLWLLRPAVKPVLGMLGLSLAAGVRVLIALERFEIRGAGSRAGIAPLDYLLTQSTVIWRYLRLLAAPFGFSCDPHIEVVRDWRGVVGWVALLALAAVLWRVYRQGRWFAAWLILLAPSSSIFPAEDLAADRRMYLPMTALALLLGAAAGKLVWRPSLGLPAMAVLVMLSAGRVQVWRSERAIWTEAVEHAPGKLRPLLLLSRHSEPAAAFALIERAEGLYPADPRPPIEKGSRLLLMNRPAAALEEFERALRRAPDNLLALNNSGAALARLGRPAEAKDRYERVLALRPCDSAALSNLQLLGAPVPGTCKGREVTSAD